MVLVTYCVCGEVSIWANRKGVHIWLTFSVKLEYSLLHSETLVLNSCYFASGKIFLSATDIRSKLLSFNGKKLNQTFIVNLVPFLWIDFIVKGKLMQQICHRDLKLENALLDGSSAPRVKICDFGYSKVAMLTSTTALDDAIFVKWC